MIVKKLGATYSPFQVVFITALLSFPIITLVMMSDQKPDTIRPKHPYWMTIRSIVGVVAALCAFLRGDRPAAIAILRLHLCLTTHHHHSSDPDAGRSGAVAPWTGDYCRIGWGSDRDPPRICRILDRAYCGHLGGLCGRIRIHHNPQDRRGRTRRCDDDLSNDVEPVHHGIVPALCLRTNPFGRPWAVRH